MMQQMLLGLGGAAGAEAMGNVDYTMCAGGGARGNATYWSYYYAWGGGGGGGYIDSFATSTNALTLLTLTPYTVTIGSAATAYGTNGSNSSIAGVDISSAFTITAIGGGGGGYPHNSPPASGDLDGNDGGSGGGGGTYESSFGTAGLGGAGTSGQGRNGKKGNPRTVYPSYCGESWAAAFAQCLGQPGQAYGGGGGGAGSSGLTTSVSDEGGIGVQNSITGSNVYRSGGGHGSPAFTGGIGYDQAGGGGSGNYPYGKNGVLILRYSNAFTISNPGGGLTIATTTVSSDKVSQITAGTGVVEFA